MGNWISCKWSDIPDDDEPYKLEAHSFIKTKKVPWLIRCKYCGLVDHNNPFTAWARRTGCNNRKHPEYKKYWRMSGER